MKIKDYNKATEILDETKILIDMIDKLEKSRLKKITSIKLYDCDSCCDIYFKLPPDIITKIENIMKTELIKKLKVLEKKFKEL